MHLSELNTPYHNMLQCGHTKLLSKKICVGSLIHVYSKCLVNFLSTHPNFVCRLSTQGFKGHTDF